MIHVQQPMRRERCAVLYSNCWTTVEIVFHQKKSLCGPSRRFFWGLLVSPIFQFSKNKLTLLNWTQLPTLFFSDFFTGFFRFFLVFFGGWSEDPQFPKKGQTFHLFYGPPFIGTEYGKDNAIFARGLVGCGARTAASTPQTPARRPPDLPALDPPSTTATNTSKRSKSSLRVERARSPPLTSRLTHHHTSRSVVPCKERSGRSKSRTCCTSPQKQPQYGRARRQKLRPPGSLQM